MTRPARPPRRRRRTPAAAAAALLAVGSLAACSAEDTPPRRRPPPPDRPSLQDRHKFGATTIRPSRPAYSPSAGTTRIVLALGEVPVSTREWFAEYPTYPWVKAALGGRPSTTFSAEINFEAIVKQQPT